MALFVCNIPGLGGAVNGVKQISDITLAEYALYFGISISYLPIALIVGKLTAPLRLVGRPEPNHRP